MPNQLIAVGQILTGPLVGPVTICPKLLARSLPNQALADYAQLVYGLKSKKGISDRWGGDVGPGGAGREGGRLGAVLRCGVVSAVQCIGCSWEGQNQVVDRLQSIRSCSNPVTSSQPCPPHSLLLALPSPPPLGPVTPSSSHPYHAPFLLSAPSSCLVARMAGCWLPGCV